MPPMQDEALSFSIVIPTYQRRDIVCRSLRSIFAIDYPGPVDIIVVIDGSTDGTVQALKALECPFPLQVIEQANGGLAAARNRGAREATGEIILFLDDDMIVDPALLRQHAATYSGGADAVVGRFAPATGAEAGFLSGGSPERAIRDPAHPDRLSAFEICGGQMSVRRCVFEAVGGFDERFTRGGRYGYEDFELGCRLLEKFDVRSNADALSYHSGAVRPRDLPRRARSCAAAEASLLKDYPEHRREFARRKQDYLQSRVLRPLTIVPLLSPLLAKLLAWLAEIAVRTPLRSDRRVEELCHMAFAVTYWCEVRKLGGLAASVSAGDA